MQKVVLLPWLYYAQQLVGKEGDINLLLAIAIIDHKIKDNHLVKRILINNQPYRENYEFQFTNYEYLGSQQQERILSASNLLPSS